MKYIIDLPDEVKWIQYIQQTGHGTINLKVESVSDLTPYTEPDEIKNNKVNLCTSCELYKEHFPECGDVNVLFGDGVGNDNICCCSGYVAKNENEIRQKVEQEVWEFAKKLISMSGNEVSEMWGCATNFGEVMYNTTYSEAKAKYEEWRKRKDEIRVGDEIVIYDETAVVLWLNEYGNVGGYVYSDGKAYINGTGITSFTKTGRHFSEVAELLKKMREE